MLDADDRGIVRFHVKLGAGAAPVVMRLDSQAPSGPAETHVVTLVADVRHTSAMSAPELEFAPAADGKVRPAVAGDPTAWSQQDLLAGGFPPRPDAATSPAHYARWLRQVSRSYVQAGTRHVEHPEVLHRKRPAREAAQTEGEYENNNSNIWCGAYYTRPNGQFAYIAADWTTPAVLALPNSPFSSAVSVWLGLDNAQGDLYQAGVAANCINFLDIGLDLETTSYVAWTELLPYLQWNIPNFPVAALDQISLDIWVADQYGTTIYQDGDNGGLTSQDNSVWFWLTNETQGVSFMGTYPTAPLAAFGETSTGFTGSTAEFICERPSFGTSSANAVAQPLAFFVPFVMNNCQYGDALYGDYTTFPLSANTGVQPFDGHVTFFNMIDKANNNVQLATPLVIPDPNNAADASGILFIWENFQ
jgi:hypothetical protein